MVMMVHITTREKAAAIKRGGLRPERRYAKTIYAMPVTPNFVMTHQWARELQKWSRQPMAGVYFRIPDDEIVHVGQYGKNKRWVAASVAAALVQASPDLGLEVQILRSIQAKDIHSIRNLRGVIGWRHFPTAHGKKPISVNRGEPQSQRIRKRLEEKE